MSHATSLDDIYLDDFTVIAKESFDVVVVGAGCYGTTVANRILELHDSARVLVADKGGFLIPEHVQNLPAAYQPLLDYVGHSPWIATSEEYDFKPQIPYIGGRALFWNGWIPQPSPRYLEQWPEVVVDELRQEWYEAGVFVGRRDGVQIGGCFGNLHLEMRERLFQGLDRIECADSYAQASALEGPMATDQTNSWRGWSKFSPVNVLVSDLHRYGRLASKSSRSDVRLRVLGHSEVQQLTIEQGAVQRITTSQGPLTIDGARVVLALGGIESASLMLNSLAEPGNIGKGIGGHIRSWLAFRFPKKYVKTVARRLEIGAFYLAGRDRQFNRDVHAHVTVALNPDRDSQTDDLYRALPDAFGNKTLDVYKSEDHCIVMMHCLGEWFGDSDEAQIQLREDGKTVVDVSFSEHDRGFWVSMDNMLAQIQAVLAHNVPEEEIEFLDGEHWTKERPNDIQKRGLVHASGMLKIGGSDRDSVTDTNCRFHGVENLFAAGGSVFPTCGSWNPTFTGIALARRLARHLVDGMERNSID